MVDEFTQQPGYLGWTSKGVILIHADWPAYALGHGIEYSLLQLGQFPLETRFQLLDEIDQCFLFFVGEQEVSELDDPFNEKFFHVGLWHEDVIDLLEAGYIRGVDLVSAREWAELKAAELRDLYYETPEGDLVPVPAPAADDFDDEDSSRGLVSHQGMVLTPAGAEALEDLFGKYDLIDDVILQRSRGLFLMQQYDTTVREACLLIEGALRDATNSESYGLRLVDEFFSSITDSEHLIDAQVKTFRVEVRAAFKFVRNEYAHNLKEISRTQCFAILARLSSVYRGIERISDNVEGS